MAPPWLIVGNWKMNRSRAEAGALAARVAEAMKDVRPDMHGRELVICPSFPLLQSVGEKVKGTGLGLGAQDCHVERGGAHTGDVSATLLADMGCTHVIVGHSERRTKHRESNSVVQAKAQAAIGVGLVAIICVGESADERAAGKTLETVEKQLRGSLPEGATAEGVAVAYEPVWAIGTDETPMPVDIAEIHAHIRVVLRDIVADSEAIGICLLYGGSVNPSNASMILRLPNVNGVLVGRASLSAKDFITIANSVPNGDD